jgi:hypothetical protein
MYCENVIWIKHNRSRSQWHTYDVHIILNFLTISLVSAEETICTMRLWFYTNNICKLLFAKHILLTSNLYVHLWEQRCVAKNASSTLSSTHWPYTNMATMYRHLVCPFACMPCSSGQTEFGLKLRSQQPEWSELAHAVEWEYQQVI